MRSGIHAHCVKKRAKSNKVTIKILMTWFQWAADRRNLEPWAYTLWLPSFSHFIFLSRIFSIMFLSRIAYLVCFSAEAVSIWRRSVSLVSDIAITSKQVPHCLLSGCASKNDWSAPEYLHICFPVSMSLFWKGKTYYSVSSTIEFIIKKNGMCVSEDWSLKLNDFNLSKQITGTGEGMFCFLIPADSLWLIWNFIFTLFS